MVKKALIVDGGKHFEHSGGKLNHFLSDFAADLLNQHPNWEAQVTRTCDSYDPKKEAGLILSADLVIWQAPAWWMGVPWTMKKYIDEVFTAGHGTLYRNDGRSRAHPEKKYGSGGLLQNTFYMISSTWNAPIEAFTEKDDFFEGKGVDAVYLPLHKANQFLNMKPLPSFIINDVIKNPNIEADQARYQKHLEKYVLSL